MAMNKLFFLILTALLITGCSRKKKDDGEKSVRITFIACNQFPIKDLLKTQIAIEEYLYKEFNIVAMIEYDDVPETIGKSGKRYNAEEIANHFQSDSFPLTIVFLNEDIEQNGKGVLGISLHPGNTCVVSSYRLKNKSDIWKLVAREFIHTYFDYSHCPNDNTNCIMKDAKEKVNFDNIESLCSTCKREILKNRDDLHQ